MKSTQQQATLDQQVKQLRGMLREITPHEYALPRHVQATNGHERVYPWRVSPSPGWGASRRVRIGHSYFTIASMHLTGNGTDNTLFFRVQSSPAFGIIDSGDPRVPGLQSTNPALALTLTRHGLDNPTRGQIIAVAQWMDKIVWGLYSPMTIRVETRTGPTDVCAFCRARAEYPHSGTCMDYTIAAQRLVGRL